MNDGAMTAFVDAMVFLIVISMALSVTIGIVDDAETHGTEAAGILDAVCSVEVLMSDITDQGDDTLVYLTDMLAYGLRSGDPGPRDYLMAVLDSCCKGRPYKMTLGFDGHVDTIGSEGQAMTSGAVRDVPVSTGGTLSLDLRIDS